jgi:UDP-glucose 4-epimerase
MRVLVTGGAGFIGHHLVAALLKDGQDVVVLDNLRRGSFERPGLAGAALIQGDIRCSEDCEAAARDCDAAVHLAAQANVMGSADDPGYAFETNVTGTWNVARACIAAGVRQLVFSSSREVYGEPQELPVSEATPFAPKNVYGATKVAGEALLSALAGPAFGVSVLRLSNVIGRGDSGRVLPLWLEAGREGRALQLFGGEQEIDFVPVETVVRAIRRVLEAGTVDGPVNIGGGRSFALAEVAERVASLFAARPAIERVPARAIEVRRFRADVTRMRDVLGIEPPEDPLNGLRDFGTDEIAL